MTKAIFLTISLFITILSQVIAGGGWPQPKGKGYFKLSEWWVRADQHYTDQGLIDPNVTIGLYNTSIYAEYGFTDRLTGILYAPLFSRSTVDRVLSLTTGEVLVEGDAINGIGDMDIALKYGITKPGQGIAVSTTLLLGLPLGEDVGGRDNNLQLGDGEFNQYLKVDAGIGLGKAYVNAYVGFNNRTRRFSDEFRYGIEGGISVADAKLWIIGRLFGVESLGNGTFSRENENFTIFANDTKFTSMSIELNYYVTESIGVSANVAGALRGELILAKPSYSFGVFYDMN